MKVEKLTTFDNFPSNSIIITHSNDYRGNSDDDIFLTDCDGNLMDDSLKSIYFKHEDRKILDAVVITHEKGAFKLYNEFQSKCFNYVYISNSLKDWDNNNPSSIAPFSKREDAIEDTNWYKKYAKRCNPETLEKKRKEFEKEKNEYNETKRNQLVKEKEEAKQWFIENGITVRIAYIFLRGLYH